MLGALKSSNIEIDPTTISWVDTHADARQAVYGSVYPADPRILQNLGQLRSELGSELFEKYAQFCLGAAVARRSVGVGPIANAKVNLKFTRIYDLGDAARKAGEDPASWLANFESDSSHTDEATLASVNSYLKAHALSTKAAYTTEQHRTELESILAKSGAKQPNRSLPGVLHQVMLEQGQRPEKRSDHPSVSEYLKFLDRIYSTPASDLSLEAGQKWPLYPIQKSPWPILMPLSMTWPLDEAEYIWQKYQGQHGNQRLKTYGPYNRFPIGVDNSLDQSNWHWNAWPSVITTGGLCGTMSSIANGTYTSIGVPMIKAGQPAHSCIVRYDINDNGEYSATVGQSVTAGPDGTSTPWLFADNPVTRNHGKYSVYSEYHYGLALGMNAGLKSYIDSRIAINLYKNLPEKTKPTLGRPLVLSALRKNPYNIEAWYTLANDARSGGELSKLLQSFNARLDVKAIRENHSDRDVNSDLGEDKVNPKQSVDSKIASLHHIGLEQMAVIGLRDLSRFSEADLQEVIKQLNALINSGNNFLLAMRDRCLCKLNGPEALQTELTQNLKDFLSNPPKGRKNVKHASNSLSKRIKAVADASESRPQREAWLRRLTETFSSEQKVSVSKTEGAQLDKFYDMIADELVKSLKSKPANKAALRSLKETHAALLKS
jgi:hypothetical protein